MSILKVSYDDQWDEFMEEKQPFLTLLAAFDNILRYFTLVSLRQTLAFVSSWPTLYHPATRDFAALYLVSRRRAGKLWFSSEKEQMAHSTRARNPERDITATNPEIVFQSARAEPNPSIQKRLPTDTNKIKITVDGEDHYVRLSKIKTMIDQAFKKSELKRNTQEATVAEKTIVYAMEMRAVDKQGGPVSSNVSLAIRSVVENILGEMVVPVYTQRTATRVVVHSSTIKAFPNAQLCNGNPMAPIATFV